MNETALERPRKFRKREDHGFVVEAVRYGTVDSKWHPDAAMKVARFIIGVNDDHVTVSNERMLDVVRPVLNRWDPAKGIADIEVVDLAVGLSYTVRLGSWVVKLGDNRLLISTPTAFRRDFEDQPEEAQSDLDTLSAEIMSILKWEESQAFVATLLAEQLLALGWRKES